MLLLLPIVYLLLPALKPARAIIYVDHASLLQSTMVQELLHDRALSREEAGRRVMEMLDEALSHFDSPYSWERRLHPTDFETLERITPQLNALMQQGENLEAYVVQGDRIVAK